MNAVLNISDNWVSVTEGDKVYSIGFIEGLEKHQGALATVQNIETWAAELKTLKGFFSLIKKEDSRVFAAVDHIRSRPLFYSIKNQAFYLSDRAEWVRQQVNDIVMDEYAKAEFQLTGYVTGKDTLYENVKQLQAGECLVYEDNKLEVKRYYSFEHSEPEEYNEKALLEELDLVAKESIQRLISYANGRQIVIPLSGGYDSRLIATLLKEANYKDVLTFTYGAKGNKEAAYSKIIADNLGLKWHFVEYTEALWQAAWKTDERKRYQLEASNWSGLAHIQDWLAVKIMKEQGLVEGDAVFAPGHSGDMVAGSHIPCFIHDDLTAKYTKEDLVEHLFYKHYCLTLHENVQIPIRVFKEEIGKPLGFQADYSAQEFANECERYNWENRQAKFIFNSVRVYEFFGYDWWIPLWDKDLVRFFEDLPLSFRNHEWYVGYVKNKYLVNNKITPGSNIGNASSAGLVKKLSQSKLIENLGIRSLLVKGYRLIVQPKSTLLIEAAFNKKDIEMLNRKGYSLNGQAAYLFLNEFGE